jgi:hypothetical protein
MPGRMLLFAGYFALAGIALAVWFIVLTPVNTCRVENRCSERIIHGSVSGGWWTARFADLPPGQAATCKVKGGGGTEYTVAMEFASRNQVGGRIGFIDSQSARTDTLIVLCDSVYVLHWRSTVAASK